MEHRSNDLFVLEFDQQAANHILQSAKWSRFLAIVWLVSCALTIIGVVIGLSYESYVGQDEIIGLVCLLAGIAVQVIANIFRFRFAKRAVKAIHDADQELLVSSLNQLRLFNKYWGIVFIIGIALFVVLFILGALSAIYKW